MAAAPLLPPDASPDTIGSLAEVVRRHGTPAYAYDVAALERRWRATRAAVPDEVTIYFSLKANPSLGLSGLLAAWGAGAEVASLGELLVAAEAGYRRVLVTGPYKSPELLQRLQALPHAIVSVDSLSELDRLPDDFGCPLILRLRSDYASGATIPLDGRFGIPLADLRSSPALSRVRQRLIGFHVHSGSQFLDAGAVTHAFRRALRLALEAADAAGITPQLLDVGGGFGVPYAPGDQPLDLEGVAVGLRAVVREAAPASVVLELGRYLVAEAGWYLTTVVGRQVRGGRRAVVVDGGTHHRADLCALGLSRRAFPPLVLGAAPEGPAEPTDVLGCLCLPDDLLAEGVALPPLAEGAVLAFGRAGAYGLTGAPSRFLSHPEPVEVAFAGQRVDVLRARPSATAPLEGQQRAPALPGPAAATWVAR